MRAQVGTNAVSAEVRFTNDGVAQTGQTGTVALRRLSDGFFLDWADDTFKSAGWTTKNQALTEIINVTELKGVYRHLFDPSGYITQPGLYSLEFLWTEENQRISEDLEFDHAVIAQRILRNRQVVNFPLSRIEYYEEDGTTVAATAPLTDKTGAAIADTDLPAGIPKDRGNLA